MSTVAISSSTFAVAIVALLFAVFVLLLLGSFVRSRRAASTLAAAGGQARATGLAAPGPPPSAAGPKPRRVLARRDFLRGGMLASLAIFAAQFGGATLAFLWPNIKGGFGSVILLPDSLDSIKSQIATSRQPYYFGAGRFYLINYEALGGTGANTIYQGLIEEGLMALFQKCAHLGCRVPFCQQSQWFECPCHGSKYNEAGEYQLGPAPQGMYRFAVKIDGQSVKVDTSSVVLGPPRGTNTIHQSPEGPFCV
jgi:cytochrome b6-f complex iron-sulfur subunit